MCSAAFQSFGSKLDEVGCVSAGFDLPVARRNSSELSTECIAKDLISLVGRPSPAIKVCQHRCWANATLVIRESECKKSGKRPLINHTNR